MNNSNNNSYNSIQMEGDNSPSIVLRKCCACGKITDRNQLIRIMCDYKNGDIIINPTNKQFGRSVYICKNIECLKLAMKKKRLKHLSDSNIEFLKNLI